MARITNISWAGFLKMISKSIPLSGSLSHGDVSFSGVSWTDLFKVSEKDFWKFLNFLIKGVGVNRKNQFLENEIIYRIFLDSCQLFDRFALF